MNETDLSLEGTRRRRYAKLNAEMAILAENLSTLQRNVTTSTNQLPILRNAITLHASILLASKEVLLKSNNDNNSNDD